MDEAIRAALGPAAGDLRASVDDGVATLELHRPERHNAVNLAMWQALARVLPLLGDSDEVDVVVLRGTPGGPFSAGADISEFQTVRREPADAERYGAAVAAGEAALVGCPKPTVAMVQGYALGGGTQLALACDLRLCDPAARFGLPPAKLGIVYALSSTARLADVVGPAWAAWLLLTGEQVDADTALRIGLVHEVVGGDGLVARVDGLVRSLRERSRVSLAGAKALLARVAAGRREDDEETRALYRASAAGPEYAEGVAAFLAKRAPDFRAARSRTGG